MTPIFAQAAAASPDYWPFAVLAISVGLIITLITVLRVHAFMALILAAFVLAEPVGVLQLLGAALAVGGMAAAVLFTGRKQG